MRTFAGLLVLEKLFDDIPEGDPNITNLANTIFTPNLLVEKQDCGTTLGKFEIINYELEGFIELSTDAPLTKERMNYLLTQNIYNVYIRHTSSCICPNGVCIKCYSATYPDQPVPVVNNRVTISPEYVFGTEIFEVKEDIADYTMLTDADSYTKFYMFLDGIFLVENVDYTVTDNVITLTETPTGDAILLVRFVLTNRTPYLVWLANTYSGSLLGMESTIGNQLVVRSLLLSSLLDDNRLQLVDESLKNLGNIPTDYSQYSEFIKDPLEKALYMLALYTIYFDAVI